MLKGEVTLGAFLLSANSFVAEAMANQPIDWLLIDMEGSHASKEDALHILQAINAYDVFPIVRIVEQNTHQVAFALDFGARGVMIPKVDTCKQAQAMAAACYFPPKGNRGMNCIRASAYYNRAAEYFARANDSVLCIVQIESKESIANIEEIAAVAEVDVLFMGPGDLSVSYGQIGQVYGTLMNNARKKLIEVCKTYGKIPGIFAHSAESSKDYINEGFKFIAIGNDIKFMNDGIADNLKKIGAA